MAPHQTQATKTHQQRQGKKPGRQNMVAKEGVKQARRRILTRQITKRGSKAATKLM